jgi:hypothetical protein
MANPPSPEASSTSPEITEIAKWVLGVSGAGIVAVAIAAVVFAPAGEERHRTITMVFNSLLPLLGTWVGTVLAYYFSRKNFESASNSVERLVSLTVEQKLGQLVVEKEMMQPGQITTHPIPQGKGPQHVLLTDLRARLGGKITRIPIVDSNGVVVYIVHQSGLFKFIGEQAIAGKNVGTLTLKDLADDAEIKNWVTNIAYISDKASVAEAKAKMEQQAGCQDLVVTRTGSKTEPMLGWMTNVDIGRLSKA